MYIAEVEAQLKSDRSASENYEYFKDLGELPPSAELLDNYFHMPVYIDTLIVNDNGRMRDFSNHSGDRTWPWKENKGGNPALSVTVNFNRPAAQSMIYRKECLSHGEDIPLRQSMTRQLVEDHIAQPGTFEHSLALLTQREFTPPEPFTLDPDSTYYGPRIACGVVAYSAPGVPRAPGPGSSSQRIVRGISEAQFYELELQRDKFVSLMCSFLSQKGFEIHMGSRERVNTLDDLGNKVSYMSSTLGGVHDWDTTNKIVEAKGLRDIARLEVFATNTEQPRILRLEDFRSFLPLSSHAENRIPGTTRGNIPMTWFNMYA